MTSPTRPVLPTGPELSDVTTLTALLDLTVDFTSNEQRARYLLSSNWMRDRGAAAAERNARVLATVRAKFEGPTPETSGPAPYPACGRCKGVGVLGGWQGRCPQCGGAS